MRPCYCLLLLLFLSLPVRAQIAGCPAESYQLNINNVEANYHLSLDDFFRLSGYVVPRGDSIRVMRRMQLWFAGRDTTGTVRFSFATQHSGPFPTEATSATPTCAWVLTRADLDQYNQTGMATDDLLNWPWENGAPVVDGDGDPNNYNLSGGDRPRMLGDQMIYWIRHDPGTEPGDHSLGLELHLTAYAFDRPAGDPLHNTSFLRLRYLNKSGEPLSDTYMGLDPDVILGDNDFYVGADTLRQMAYFYGEDELSPYGNEHPAFGIVVTDSPSGAADARDNDRDGTVDEADEELGLTAFVSFNGDNSPIGRPAPYDDYHRYLRGVLRTGDPITVGGSGFNYGNPETTTYMYPGDPVTGAFWSHENLDGNGERAYGGFKYAVLGTGPFDFGVGEAREIEYAFVWSRSFNRLLSVEQLRRDVDQLFYGKTPGAVPPPPPTPALIAPVAGDTVASDTVHLRWHAVPAPGNALRFYQYQFSPSPTFDEGLFEHTVQSPSGAQVSRTDTTVTFTGLWANRTYYWRVRAENLGGASPWSEVRTVTIGEEGIVPDNYTGFFTVANPDGPLPPMVGAAAPWQGFPAPARPTADSTGMAGQWLIHTADNGIRSDYEAFVSRTTNGGQVGDFNWRHIVPYDFEIRFTETGSRAYDPFVTGCYFAVPFELWDIGSGTPDDPSDDRQLVPYVLDDDGTAVHGFDGLPGFNLFSQKTHDAFAAEMGRPPFATADHSVDAGNDDPQTDWIYLTVPDDTSYGTAGYEAWVAHMDARLGLGNCDDGSLEGEKTTDRSIRRLTFVSWNGGDVCNDTDGDGVCETPDYRQALPPTGAVFRITTSPQAAFPEPAPPVVAEEVPTGLQLHGNYPNPFNPVTQIAFDLPEDAAVRVSVYDLLGRRVALVEAGVVAAGIARTVRVDGSGWASGVYVYRLEARGARQAWQQTGRMLLVK